MRTTTKILISSAAGFALGVASMERLTAASMPTLLNLVRTTVKVEEEFTASREARLGNHDKALVHRWNAATLSRADGQDPLSRHFNEATSLPFLAPRLVAFEWALYARVDREKVRCGTRISEGRLRRKLSANLRELGFHDWSASEAARAEELIDSSNWSAPTYSEVLAEEADPLFVDTESVALGLTSSRRPTRR